MPSNEQVNWHVKPFCKILMFQSNMKQINIVKLLLNIKNNAEKAKSTDSAKEAATPVKEDKAEKKPAAKVDPRYDKIFWPTAGKVWSNTLTVIIVAALMAGTIFLVDLGLRAIIDGFMSI